MKFPFFKRKAKSVCDTLKIEYEKFPEDNITALTVVKGNKILEMFEDEEADRIHNLLTGQYKHTPKEVTHWGWGHGYSTHKSDGIICTLVLHNDDEYGRSIDEVYITLDIGEIRKMIRTLQDFAKAYEPGDIVSDDQYCTKFE